jgi:hypothetical protein
VIGAVLVTKVEGRRLLVAPFMTPRPAAHEVWEAIVKTDDRFRRGEDDEGLARLER